MKTIHWGIIGCGNVTEVKSGPGFQKANNSQLVAVMRRNGALAKDYAGRHGVRKWYDDASALIADTEVDAVYIATPPASHKEYTLAVARAGKPVYVEKPMALNYAECVEMIEACRSAGVKLFVAYYRRALPRFLKVKELVESGVIGQVRSVAVSLYTPPAPDELDPSHLPWRVLPEISGGGRFVDMASHTLDFLDYVFGPIQLVKGLAANQAHLYPAEDIVSAAFRFESGVQGSGMWCFSSFHNQDTAEVVGSQGRVAFSSFGTDPVVLTTREGVTEFPIPNPPHIQQPFIQQVVDELNGVGASPSTGVTGARTTWVMDEMLKEYRRKMQEA
jgi:predicted dehydrogenase